jgi:hypothetical protein
MKVNVSEEHIASVFRAEQYDKQEISMEQAAKVGCSLFERLYKQVDRNSVASF